MRGKWHKKMHVERLEAKAADMSLELGYLGLEQHVRPRPQSAQAATWPFLYSQTSDQTCKPSLTMLYNAQRSKNKLGPQRSERSSLTRGFKVFADQAAYWWNFRWEHLASRPIYNSTSYVKFRLAVPYLNFDNSPSIVQHYCQTSLTSLPQTEPVSAGPRALHDV